MRNNQAPMTPAMQQNNLIYEYQCIQDDCEHLPEASYVGLTTTTLSRRITMHLGSGGPKSHNEDNHNQNPISRELMVENTKILRRENDFRRLQIYEALIIQQKRPLINNQVTGSCRTLKLYNNENTKHPRYRNPPKPPIPSNQNNSQNKSRNSQSRSVQNRQVSSITTVPSPPISPANNSSMQSMTQPNNRINYKIPTSHITASQPAPSTRNAPRRSTRVRNRNT